MTEVQAASPRDDPAAIVPSNDPIEVARLPDLVSAQVAILGLGYVGLSLATALGRLCPTLGYDIDAARVSELREGRSERGEFDPNALRAATKLKISSDELDVAGHDIFICAVPTPVTRNHLPDLVPLRAASALIGRSISRGGVAIFESTVHPGATEEICVPIIEDVSGLLHNVDFFTGYSPERIDPGNGRRGLADVPKVTSGSTPEAASLVDALYRDIVPAGTYMAPSIRVAEMAKIVENTQRDVNIAFMNEVALLCHKLGIDSGDVLAAAATKWNFLRFAPGLVGGECIPVDPYYLAHKAAEIGLNSELILAARNRNESVPWIVVARVAELLAARNLAIDGARVLVLGLAYKENCGDARNSRAIELVNALRDKGATIDVHDPLVNDAQVHRLFGVASCKAPRQGSYDAVILTVAHRDLLAQGAESIRRLLRRGGVLFDIRHALPRDLVDGRL